MRVTAAVAGCILAAQAAAAQSTATPRSAPLALVNVNIIDIERGRLVPNQTVVVTGTRIASVSPAARTEIPPMARLIDATGLFVIPGLWDMHAHVLGNYEDLALVLLPNGVVGVRHPGNSRLDTLMAVRARIHASAEPLPRLVAAGVLIDGPSPARPAGSVVLARAEDARGLADSLLANGVDYFKTYSRIRPEAFLALAAEARRRGVVLTGHVPGAMTPTEVSDAGMRSIEHVFEFPVACSTREDDMRRLRVQAEGTSALRAVRQAISDTVIGTYDAVKCRRIAARLAANGTYLSPTLQLYKRMGPLPGTVTSDSLAALYFAQGLPPGPPRLPEWGVSAAHSRARYARLAEIVRDFHAGGVQLLAGTDTDAPLMWAGFSLHDEMATLVTDAGLTPAEALRTATWNPAQYFAATDSMGSVAAGKVADLVLLSANPLADISNSRRIAGVVVKGRYLSRQDLDAMLREAARKAQAAHASSRR